MLPTVFIFVCLSLLVRTEVCAADKFDLCVFVLLVRIERERGLCCRYVCANREVCAADSFDLCVFIAAGVKLG